MSGLTPEGLDIRTHSEIVEGMKKTHRDDWGEDFDTDADIIGTNAVITANELAIAWEALGELYSALDPRTNTGTSQDFTAAVIGVQRQSGSPSQVPNALVVGSANATVTAANFLAEYQGVVYRPVSTVTCSAAAASRVVLDISDLTSGFVINFTIDGQAFQYTVLANETPASFTANLVLAINANVAVSPIVTASVAEVGGEPVVHLDIIDQASTFAFASTTLPPDTTLKYGVKVDLISLTDSNQYIPATTPLVITLPANDVDYVTTVTAGQAGRNLETPAELRVRRELSFSNSGGGSLDSIKGKVAAIEGVVSVAGTQNVTKAVDANGLPASSYHIIVTGTATDDNVAGVILASGPAGIETFGSTTVNLSDSEGNPQQIRFSRTEPIFTHFRVAYTIFNEEDVPTDVNLLIATALMEIASRRSGTGIDLLPSVYGGYVAATVPGLETVTVTIDTTTLPTDAPTWTAGRKVVTPLQIPQFNADRVTVI